MTGKDGRTLVIGIIIGLTVATSMFVFEGKRRLEPAAAAPGAALDSGGSMAGASAAGQQPDGASYAQLTEDEQKEIGVQTVEVKRQTIRREIVAPGKVAEPETGSGTIRARVGGRIEKLLINVIGGTVNRGQPVALIYSPEAVTAGEEYRLALRNRQRFSQSTEQQAIAEADEQVRASQRRLELWGLSGQQIEQIASSPGKSFQVATYSPVSGVITKRNVAEGEDVSEGDVLFEIEDLATVWVQAEIFDSDPPLPRTGQRVKITAPSLEGSSIEGVVSFIQPSLIVPINKSFWSSVEGAVSFVQPSVDPQNRTLTARIQVPNSQMRLRPGMFVQVSFDARATDVVAIPRSAVLDTGKGKVVYVAKENGVFEKHYVEASIAGDDYYVATRGIQPGERVVTHGNFLIDSQTRLTSTIAGMFSGSKTYGNDTTAAQSNRSKYTLTLQSEPAPPKGGSEGTFHVNVIGPDKRPVADAHVQMTLTMPAMPSMGMAEMHSVVDLAWNGSEYAGKGAVAMAGPWSVTVEARRDGLLLGVYRTRFDAK